MTQILGWARRAAAALCLIGSAVGAHAQSFPSKPVTIVAPFPPGGTVDLLARALAPKLGELWKQPVIVENRPGASGVVGSQAVAKSAPDGSMLLMVPLTHVTNVSLFTKVPYDPVADFTPISLLASQPVLLVANKSQPLDSVADLVALARAHPGKLNCGSGGNGTSQHLACELFNSMAKTDIRHIPYKGNAAAMTDVIGGQIELLFDQMATAVPHVKSGKVKALAVTSAQRSPAMPEVPTVAEAGVPGYDMVAWFGLVGPPGMPKETVARIQADAVKVLSAPELKERLAAQGLDVGGSTPEQFGAHLRAELAKWSKVFKDAGIKAD